MGADERASVGGGFAAYRYGLLTLIESPGEGLLLLGANGPLRTSNDLPDRALLHVRLDHALARARGHGGRVAVMFLDLDGFKLVNDGRGHQAGDGLLIKVAHRLLEIVRAEDTVARFGGDEFVVVCEVASIEAAIAAGERVLASCPSAGGFCARPCANGHCGRPRRGTWPRSGSRSTSRPASCPTRTCSTTSRQRRRSSVQPRTLRNLGV